MYYSVTRFYKKRYQNQLKGKIRVFFFSITVQTLNFCPSRHMTRLKSVG